jgi:TRAP-type C4-dicarboxylate transport system substrate-binding protein
VVLAAAAFFLPGSPVSIAAADGPVVIRYASLAPPGSAFGKILKAWGRQFKKETEGRAELRFYTGGSQGDERDFIRKIRAGQIDAAGITTTGMGMVVRPILVLTAPGLITELEQLYHVRVQLRARFDELFRNAGFELLHWGDGGKNRLFSTYEFARPEDLKSRRPWAWKDDPVFAGFLSAIGANPVRVGANEVYGGLQTRMIDTVPASAIVAVAIQWYTKLNYMAKQNLNIVIGGSIIKQEVFNQLTPRDQEILIRTGERSARAMDKIVMRDDARAYQTLLQRGIVEVDLTPHQAEWDAMAKSAREQLAGRVYSKSLLAQVTKLSSEK